MTGLVVTPVAAVVVELAEGPAKEVTGPVAPVAQAAGPVAPVAQAARPVAAVAQAAGPVAPVAQAAGPVAPVAVSVAIFKYITKYAENVGIEKQYHSLRRECGDIGKDTNTRLIRHCDADIVNNSLSHVRPIILLQFIYHSGL